MRVLFCSYQAVANPGGGVLIQVIKSKDYLAKQGVEVELFNSWKRYNWSRFDVIHVFSTDMRNYFLLQMIPSDIPLVVSPIIDKTFHPYLATVFALLSKQLPPPVLTSYKAHTLAFDKADVVIARSADERRILKRGFGVPLDRIREVPNGVDEKFLYADASLFRKKYGLENFVLYVGHIGNPRKNLLRLLEVAKQLKDVPFVLVGPILETPHAKKVIFAAKKLPNVRILGRLPEEELISAYAACEVFVLPSLVEGTGLVGLEAGLAGAKVVVTNRGGTTDYFGEGAILVDPTVESIKRGITRALTSPYNYRLRERIVREFLWPKVAKKLIHVYEEMFNE